ncbi:hypothetical protein JTB14_029830 [Gonioctena quinquepunctata]|nr:hypothetical protein JTB14_029830 [Gonioctena quinquepunctata]
MASTVEPCENKSSGIATLSSTLELFDTFKPSQDEEKDSDEESFHLPLLGCDDDMDSNNKRTSRAATPSAENEDDILNKFETNATPDLDPKMEDIILDGDDESLVKNVGEPSEKTKIPTENSNSANCSGEEKIEDKVGEDSTCIDDNGETDEIQRLPENNTDQSEKPEDKEAILHAETKNTSETDDNTDSDVFKDLDIVDELDESFEETSEQDTKKANELDNDEVDKKYDNNEKNQETDQMDVEISEAIENHSNEKDIATTVEDTHGDEKKGQADGEPVEKHTTEDLIHNNPG